MYTYILATNNIPFAFTDPCTISYCGVNAQCRTKDHTALCSCPEPLEGDPLVRCEQVTKSCSSDSGCSAAARCLGSVCVSRCTNAEKDCLANEVCVGGTCKRICSSSAQCGEGLVCIDRTCMGGCSSDTQCKSNEVCTNGQCVGKTSVT